MPSRARLLLVSVLLFASVALVPAPVFGADDRREEAANRHRLTVRERPLRDMVKDAQPVVFEPGAVTQPRPWGAPQEVGAMPYFVPPQQPTSNRYNFTRAGVQTRERSRASRSGPIAYTRFEITNPAQNPYWLHGKIFMFFDQGIGFCSGTIVPSAAQDLVLTAGHCLMDPETGAVPNEVHFVPGYREGSSPFGAWPATEMIVTNEWAASVAAGQADPRYDLAALHIAPAEDGTTLGATFGSRGVMFNVDYRQQFDSFGYPANDEVITEFTGEYLYSCESAQTNLQDDTVGSPFTIGMGCDMTEGSSGGGWVIDEDQEGGFVNSVVSYSYGEIPEVQFGPYFGTSAQAFYEEVSGLDGGPDPEPGGDHEMNLSIRLRRHLVAKGVMTATDGYSPCAAGAPVILFKYVKSRDTFRQLKETTTSASGTWRIKVADRTGYYAALGPEGPVDEENFCLEAISKVVRHRH